MAKEPVIALLMEDDEDEVVVAFNLSEGSTYLERCLRDWSSEWTTTLSDFSGLIFSQLWDALVSS
jgi:hypothetical protein